jgi:dolichol-phosphate mannosyltransferase
VYSQQLIDLSVSVIMPCLNEEGNVCRAIANTLQAFEDDSLTGEIVVVNDGSTDRTREQVLEYMDREPRIKLVDHGRPEGIGASFWDGFARSSHEIVSMFPGDNETDPWEILRYIWLLEHVDMVIPFVFNTEVRPFMRRVLSFIYRTIVNVTFMANFNYTNGTVLYRRSLLEDLEFHSTSFFFQSDILVRSARKGYLFAEVPYKLGLRPGGVSKAVTYPALLKVIRGYLNLVKDMHLSAKGKIRKPFAEGTMTERRRLEKSKMV